MCIDPVADVRGSVVMSVEASGPCRRQLVWRASRARPSGTGSADTEALTLAGFRQIQVPMQRVRKALDYASKHLDLEHLLANQRLLTDGKELFWEFQERSRDGKAALVNLSRGGQKAFPEAVMRYLREMEWGKDSFATRWWPGSEPRAGAVVIDPRRAFGAPVLAEPASGRRTCSHGYPQASLSRSSPTTTD